MTQAEAIDRNSTASIEFTREDTIRQVMDWCTAQEAVVLSQPGREINLALYRRDWDHSTTFCPGINISSRSVDEAIKQYVDAVTHGRHSHGDLLDSLASQPLQPKDNVLVRQMMVNTHTPQLKFGVREYLDPDGRVLGQEYFLHSLKSKKIRGRSSDVPLSMTGGFW